MEKNYRVGVVGLSGIAANRPAAETGAILTTPSPTSHLSAYHHLPQTDVVALCELKTELFEKVAQTWGQEFGELETYTDYRAMIEREELDIISVCTSDNRHTDIVVAAAEAGVKGIICEKPLATTVDECTRMIEACEANGRLDLGRPHQPLAPPLRRGQRGDPQQFDRQGTSHHRPPRRPARDALPQWHAPGRRRLFLRRIRPGMGLRRTGTGLRPL